MTPALAKALDNESHLARLLYLLGKPTREMIEEGRTAIRESVVAEYIGATAPQDIFSAMLTIALKQVERG